MGNSLTLYDLPSAVSNSAEIKLMKLDVENKKIDIDNQIFEYLPDLNLKYGGSFNRPFMENYTVTHSIALVSSWDILRSGNRALSHIIARLEYESLLMDYESVYQNQLYTASSLYINALKSKRQYEFALSNEVLSRTQYERAKTRHSQGMIPEVDMLNAEADYESAIYRSKSYQTQYESALSQLKRALLLDDIALYDIEFADFKPIHIENIESSVSNTFEMLKLINSHRIQNLRKTIAIKERWIPSLSLSAGIDWGNLNFDSLTETWNTQALEGRVNLSVSFPIFENNQKLNDIKKSDLQLQKSVISMSNTSASKSAELSELLDNHDNMAMLVSISARRLESARIGYEKTRESHNLGLMSQIELYEAEKRFRDANLDYIFDIFELLSIRLKIGNILGNTLMFIGNTD
jgi:outer membrane protein TolC